MRKLIKKTRLVRTHELFIPKLTLFGRKNGKNRTGNVVYVRDDCLQLIICHKHVLLLINTSLYSKNRFRHIQWWFLEGSRSTNITKRGKAQEITHRKFCFNGTGLLKVSEQLVYVVITKNEVLSKQLLEIYYKM